jgi:hypothetical protein
VFVYTFVSRGFGTAVCRLFFNVSVNNKTKAVGISQGTSALEMSAFYEGLVCNVIYKPKEFQYMGPEFRASYRGRNNGKGGREWRKEIKRSK